MPAVKALQVFNCDSSAGVFSLRNDLFGNYMVNIFLKSCFTTGEFLQMTFGRLRTTLLQGLLDLSCALADSINLLAGEYIAVRSSRKVNDAKIYAESAFGIKGNAIWNFYNHIQKKLTSFKSKVCLPSHAVPVKVGIFTENKENLLPSIDSVDAGDSKVLERKEALVINNSRMLLESMQGFLVNHIALSNLRNGANNELRRKLGKFLSGFPVSKVVEVNLTESCRFKSSLRDMVTGIVKGLHSIFERLMLFWRRKQFNFHGKFHSCRIASILQVVKQNLKGSGHSSP